MSDASHDDGLRARFHALAAEMEAAAPDVTATQIRAWRAAMRIERQRHWRAGALVGAAAAAVITLTVGLILGASTGYASAESIVRERGDVPLPAVAKLAGLRIPPLSFACTNAVGMAEVQRVQAAKVPQGVPIVDLPAPATRSSVLLHNPRGVVQLSNGNLIVDDAGNRQIKLFDSSLVLQSVLRDSAAGSATSYGARPLPMMQWLGDSVLLADYNAGSILLMAPNGQIARAIAPPSFDMLVGLIGARSKAVDDKGRIIITVGVRDDPTLGVARAKFPDSSLLVRYDLDARRADTLARLKSTGTTKLLGREGNGPVRFSVEPVPLTDAFDLLSDGSIAIVRGHDYHIDWIRPDGSTFSSPKLPFDWKRLGDDEKQRLIDSVRTNVSASLGRALGQRRTTPDENARPGGRSGGGQPVEQGPPMPTEYVAPDLKDVFDFYPPIRGDALMADLDGNLWILPTTSAQSKHGELVYDVVNPKGSFRRVRFPLGMSLAGFGRGGVVYLLHGDRTNGFYLERTNLPR
ncbi:MAG TPA: hypothetical protein VH277_11985 [Gemmatimonadaceae bacterium]|nr:hypothetical protein [Gemmatimonadaceae bacterium]